MKLTKSQQQEFRHIKKELGEKGVPDLITRAEALHICDTYALDAPMFKRGSRTTPFRTIDVIVYMVRRGVCSSKTSRRTTQLEEATK